MTAYRTQLTQWSTCTIAVTHKTDADDYNVKCGTTAQCFCHTKKGRSNAKKIYSHDEPADAVFLFVLLVAVADRDPDGVRVAPYPPNGASWLPAGRLPELASSRPSPALL